VEVERDADELDDEVVLVLDRDNVVSMKEKDPEDR